MARRRHPEAGNGHILGLSHQENEALIRLFGKNFPCNAIQARTELSRENSPVYSDPIAYGALQKLLIKK